MRGLAIAGIGVLVTGAIVLIARHDAGSVGGFRNDDFAAIVSGVAILILVGSSVLYDMRKPGGLAASLKAALTWIVIGLALVVLYTLRDDLTAVANRVTGELMPWQAEQLQGGSFILRRAADGHFHVEAGANGAPIQLMVDTGATSTVLTRDDAAAAGLDPEALDYIAPVDTANGRSFMARARLQSLTMGGNELRDVRVLVARPGQLDTSLLGNNALNRFSSVSIQGDEITLTP